MSKPRPYDREKYLRRKALRHAAGVTSNGKPWKARAKTDPAARFWPKVQKSDGCWLWLAGVNRQGYGKFTFSDDKKHTIGAHRMSYILAHGEIPAGKDVLHRCDNPPCVNPDHLWLGTIADNMKDKVAKGRQAKGVEHARTINIARAFGRGIAPKGEEQWNAKVTENDVREIRRMHLAGLPLKAIVARFPIIGKSNAWCIAKRKTWKHVA